MCGRQVSSRSVIVRWLHFIFVFSESCLLPHGLRPLPILGVLQTSTPTPRIIEYRHGVNSPCSCHNGESTPVLEFFTRVRLYLLDLGSHSHLFPHIRVRLPSPKLLLPRPLIVPKAPGVQSYPLLDLEPIPMPLLTGTAWTCDINHSPAAVCLA